MTFRGVTFSPVNRVKHPILNHKTYMGAPFNFEKVAVVHREQMVGAVQVSSMTLLWLFAYLLFHLTIQGLTVQSQGVRAVNTLTLSLEPLKKL